MVTCEIVINLADNSLGRITGMQIEARTIIIKNWITPTVAEFSRLK